MKKIPNIVIFLIVAILLMLIVYLYFRTKEKYLDTKQKEQGNFFTNLFSNS